MVLLPPAPQAGASASSATSAWPCVRRYVLFGRRRRRRRRSRCRCYWCRSRRGWRRRCRRAADDRARPALTEDRQRKREQHEKDRRNRGRFRQQRRARARAECRLAAAAAERAGDVAAAPLLQKDHQRQHKTGQDVNSDQCVIHVRFQFAVNRLP